MPCHSKQACLEARHSNQALWDAPPNSWHSPGSNWTQPTPMEFLTRGMRTAAYLRQQLADFHR